MLHQISSSDLPDLLFTHRSKYDATKLTPPHNLQYQNKPGGGIWTSPANDRGESHWSSWHVNDQSEVLTYRYRVQLHDNARILVIDTLTDLVTASQAYPYTEQVDPEYQEYLDILKYNSTPLDWESLADDFDAIWLTKNGLADACPYPFEHPEATLYSWDVETVFILNSHMISSVNPW